MTSSALPAARTYWPSLRRSATAKPRIVGLDAARGLAVIGMVIAHTAAIGAWGASPSALLGFAHGRSSILFATIAGVSLALLSGGASPLTGSAMLRARMSIIGRAFVLMIVSGLLEVLGTPVALILASYALWFVLALPFLRLRPRTLLIMAAAIAIVGGYVSEAVLGLLGLSGRYVPNNPEAFVPSLLFDGVYPGAVWMAFVFTGMAIGRANLSNVAHLARFLVAGLALFVVFAAPFVIQERSPEPLFGTHSEYKCLDGEALRECTAAEYEEEAKYYTEEELTKYGKLKMESVSGSEGSKWVDDPSAGLPELSFLWTMAPHSGAPFEVFSSGGFAMAAISGLVLLGRRRVPRLLMAPLIGVGSMSLTAYAAHAVVMAAVPAEAYDTNLFAGLLILGLVVGCWVWHRFFTSGPLEQLVAAVADRVAGRQRGASSTSLDACPD